MRPCDWWVTLDMVERRQTYAVPWSACGPSVDDSELMLPGDHASLGCRCGDRSLAPQPCWQGLGDKRRQPDQPALFDAAADSQLECHATQGGLDDPSERL